MGWIVMRFIVFWKIELDLFGWVQGTSACVDTMEKRLAGSPKRKYFYRWISKKKTEANNV